MLGRVLLEMFQRVAGAFYIVLLMMFVVHVVNTRSQVIFIICDDNDHCTMETR